MFSRIINKMCSTVVGGGGGVSFSITKLIVQKL